MALVFDLISLLAGRTTVTGTGEWFRRYRDTLPSKNPLTELRPRVPTTNMDGSYILIMCWMVSRTAPTTYSTTMLTCFGFDLFFSRIMSIILVASERAATSCPWNEGIPDLAKESLNSMGTTLNATISSPSSTMFSITHWSAWELYSFRSVPTRKVLLLLVRSHPTVLAWSVNAYSAGVSQPRVSNPTRAM